MVVLVFMVIGMLLGDREMPRRQIIGHPENESGYRPGETAVLIWEFETIRDCPGYATRRLILPTQSVVLPSSTIARRGLSDEDLPYFTRLRIEVPIPEDARPGQAYYDIKAFYRCNPMHGIWPITVDFPAIPLLIVEP